ncbi:MAG: TIGR02757 family protein [Planctomycetota bacterium]
MNKRATQLTKVLERLYAKYNHREFIPPDPLQFVYQYSDPGDKEVVGFLAAQLAYGRVQQIEKSVTDLLGRMGDSPVRFVRNFDKHKRNRLEGFKHRFTTADCLSDLLLLLKEVLNQYGSIEAFFVRGYNPNDKNIISALSNFCESLLDIYSETDSRHIPRGLSYLLCRPSAGSACKRLNLFLRWMVRNDEVDVGLWTSVDKSKLIVPVDVHMGRLCRILGLHNRRTVSLSAAIEITESFAEVEPGDPVKYDFALSRIGILENCTGRYQQKCEDCELLGFCCRGRSAITAALAT